MQGWIEQLQLKQINACQMYLHITMIAEVTNHTSTKLIPQAFSSNSSAVPLGLSEISQSCLDWPTIHQPSKVRWKLWTKTMHSIYTGSNNGDHLQNPLRAWQTTYQTTQFWKWRLSTMGHLLNQKAITMNTRAAIPIVSQWHQVSYSLMILTNQRFKGPPVTPSNTHHRNIAFLIPHYPH